VPVDSEQAAAHNMPGEEKIGMSHCYVMRNNRSESVFVYPDKVGPGYDGDEFAFAQYRDPAEIIAHQAPADIDNIIFLVKSKNIRRHIIADAPADKFGVIKKLQDVFFGNNTAKLRVVNHGQPGNIVLDHQVYGIIDGGVFID
jgi:hypothetical protein